MDFTLPPVGSPEFTILFDALSAYTSDLGEVVNLGAPPEVVAKLELAEAMESKMAGALAALA